MQIAPLFLGLLAAGAVWLPAAAETLVLADFEATAPGLTGAIARDPEQPHAGQACGRMRNLDQKWITASSPKLTTMHDFASLDFWVRGEGVERLAVRLRDSTGQYHQQRLRLAPGGQWQPLSLTRFDTGSGYESWGGAKDRRWHPPAIQVEFILEAHGTVWLDDVRAELDPRVLPPLLAWRQAQLGNLFLAGEEVVLSLASAADTVAWTVTDYWQQTVAQGETPVDPETHQARLQPPAQPGYYLVRVQARQRGSLLSEAATSYAVLPPLPPGDRRHWGAMTHFAQGMNPEILPLLARIGIGSVRDEHYWGSVERVAGQYAFSPAGDRYMAACRAAGIEPLIVMSFANKLYDDNHTPYTPAGCAAYANYGKAILDHYGDQVQALEVWNEYNGSWCDGPAAADRPRYHTQMLKAAYERLKATRPDVQVLGAAPVLIPMPYLRGIFAQGGLAFMDAVVVHPYRNTPEGVDTEMADLQALVREYNAGRDKPIWVTETGLLDKAEAAWESGRQYYEAGRLVAADYLARQLTLLASAGAARIYWYLAQDHRGFRGMGLLRQSDDPFGRCTPSPVAVAYATLVRQLEGTRFGRREPGPEALRIYRFDGPAGEVRVCWATQPTHVVFKVPGPVQAVDLMGGSETLTPVGGEVFLTLGTNARYLRGPVTEVALQGAFTVAASQRLELGQPAALELSACPPGALLEIDGRRQAPQAGRILLPGRETAQAAAFPLRYRLLAAGQLAGLGEVAVQVHDPLAWQGEPCFLPDGALGFTLANQGCRQSYQVETVIVRVAGQERRATLNQPLPPGQAVTIAVPGAAPAPFQAVPVQIDVQCRDRAPVSWSGRAAANTLSRRSLTVDGDLGDWDGVPPLDLDTQARAWGRLAATGTAFLAADAQYLYVAARVQDREPRAAADAAGLALADSLTVGLAALDGSDWRTYACGIVGEAPAIVQTLGAPAPARAQVRREGDETIYELALPLPPGPEAAARRVALSLSDRHAAGSGWRAWGGGLRPGQTPAEYQVCPVAAPGASAPLWTLRPLPPAPGAPRRLLADSRIDYAKEQGVRGWSYGYYAGEAPAGGNGSLPSGPYTADDFQLMTRQETMWGDTWQGPAKFLNMGSAGAHPEAREGQPLWAVRRWCSPVGGRLRLSGSFSHEDVRGDGIEGRILVDGVQCFRGQLGGRGTLPFDVAVAVRPGACLDFAVTPGPAADNTFDSTGFRATIEELAPSQP